MLLLFSKEPLKEYLERWKINIKREIESTANNYLLNTSEDDFVNYLVSKYSLSVPVLHEADTRMQQEEIRLDGHEKPTAERATMLSGKLKVTISIPFEGNSHFFNYAPSKTPYGVPQGEIQHQNKILQLFYEISDRNADRLKSVFCQDLETIKRYLERSNEEVAQHNVWVREKAKTFLSERKNQILLNLGFAQSLGISFEEDNNLPKTYPVPLKTETITISKPESPREGFKPEPTIDQADYEKILEKFSLMSVAMERNPQTFSKLHEEEIRDFFLIVLNSHFKGQATSETFNNEGRTDILLRVEGKNAFIAECKFWKGRKILLETIDQILGYLSWRDTKAAILLFCKGGNFTEIFSKMCKAIVMHQNYKRPFELKNSNLSKETTSSYVFHNPNDKNREIYLTVLAFPMDLNYPSKVDMNPKAMTEPKQKLRGGTPLARLCKGTHPKG